MGTINDLRFLLYAIAVGVSKSHIYAGVRLFKALYVKTALLQLIRWDTVIPGGGGGGGWGGGGTLIFS